MQLGDRGRYGGGTVESEQTKICLVLVIVVVVVDVDDIFLVIHYCNVNIDFFPWLCVHVSLIRNLSTYLRRETMLFESVIIRFPKAVSLSVFR
jgi:hypothetical protein